MTRRLAKKIIRRVRRGEHAGYTLGQRYRAANRLARIIRRHLSVRVTVMGVWAA